MKSIYKVQTCNGNPEVIRLENGIAKEIVAGERRCLSLLAAQGIARDLNKLAHN